MNKLSDIEIIESVKRGNQNDYSLIIDRYKSRAFSMLKRMLGNEMDAEEVLMDSFLKAYNNINNFRGDAKFSTWFYKIAYNNGLSFLSSKRRKNEKDLSSLEDHFDLYDHENKIYAESENVSMYLLKLVDKLPIKYALVLILFYIDEMNLTEISQVMGTSLVNVKVTLHRSRNALKEMIIKHNYQEELK